MNEQISKLIHHLSLHRSISTNANNRATKYCHFNQLTTNIIDLLISKTTAQSFPQDAAAPPQIVMQISRDPAQLE